MKPKHLLLLCCILGLLKANAQRPFITTWNTGNPGVSKDNQIFFYATGSSYRISWVNTQNANDTGSKIASGDDTVTFAMQGIYRVYIMPGNGTFSAFRVFNFNNGDTSDCNKLLSLEQWGDIQWMNLEYTFFNCTNMVMNATDNPNLSNLTSMAGAFEGCHSFTTNNFINNWDVSKVTNMTELFDNSHFNSSIDKWNVSNVILMTDMFADDSLFNQPISNWNTKSLTDASVMFGNAIAFNQPLVNWNMSNVTTTNGMFFSAISFNQPIGNWNVNKVLNMYGMFDNAKSFNQPIGKWDVSNVVNMTSMFQNAVAFNQPLDKWDVSKVTNMQGMFAAAFAFNQPIGNWNVSSSKYMTAMFNEARAFDQNIGSWNISSALGLSGFFDSSGMSCKNYSLTLKGWADSSTTPDGLFFSAYKLIYDSSAKAAHDSLINVKRWMIMGDGLGNCSGILPVSFLSFTALQQGNTALLNWHVAYEINVKGYNVEKSVNGFNYASLGFVAAKANKQTNYAYTDNNLVNGTTYYYIKEIDNDGRYVYSFVQKIEYSRFAWKIKGNPVNNSSVALTLNKPANVLIQIISSTGIIIKTINKRNLITGNYNIPLNIDNVSAGLYLIRLMVDDKAYSSTIVKQ